MRGGCAESADQPHPSAVIAYRSSAGAELKLVEQARAIPGSPVLTFSDPSVLDSMQPDAGPLGPTTGGRQAEEGALMGTRGPPPGCDKVAL